MICVLDPDTGGPLDVTCRPIARDSVAECTPGFSCVDGICGMGNGRVEDDELVALCLAGDARCAAGIDYGRVSEAIDESCDEETDLCSVPEECTP
jgi:hypothetical protein